MSRERRAEEKMEEGGWGRVVDVIKGNKEVERRENTNLCH